MTWHCRSADAWHVRVASATERGVTYNVRWEIIGTVGRYVCDCRGFRYAKKPGTPCSHISAARVRHCNWRGDYLEEGRCPKCGSAVVDEPNEPAASTDTNDNSAANESSKRSSSKQISPTYIPPPTSER